MARSELKTWLSLDEWAKLIGLHPFDFNQIHSSTLQRNNVVGEPWFQQSWLHSDRIGRDDVALAIQQAEQEISREIGFNLMPDWTIDERLPYPRPQLPEAFGVGLNVRGMLKSIELPRGHVIMGGIRHKTLLQAAAAIVRSDVDSDGYQETCTVTVATTVTDLDQYRVYYPSQSGSDEWEVRPIKVTVSGGFATITFKIWQVVAGNQMDSLAANILDADVVSNFETTVDVYLVDNDPSTQVQFMWENDPTVSTCGDCTACQLGTQYGCFHLRDPRMGFIVPSPGEWNASTLSFDSAIWNACREPDQVRMWYLSGYKDNSLVRPYAELSPKFKPMVAFYACSKFERPVNGASNINQFIDRWRRDAAFSSQEEGGFTETAEIMGNRLGTSAGALYAYRQIQQLGMRVNK